MGYRIPILVAGVLLVAYGLWGLYSGKILSTWGQVQYRPSVIYWVTVGLLILLGGANIWVVIRSWTK